MLVAAWGVRFGKTRRRGKRTGNEDPVKRRGCRWASRCGKASMCVGCIGCDAGDEETARDRVLGCRGNMQ